MKYGNFSGQRKSGPYNNLLLFDRIAIQPEWPNHLQFAWEMIPTSDYPSTDEQMFRLILLLSKEILSPWKNFKYRALCLWKLNRKGVQGRKMIFLAKVKRKFGVGNFITESYNDCFL